MKRVLFVCLLNSGRSQMAQALGEAISGGDMEFESAGTMPAREVDPVVVQAMRERGVELAGREPKLLTDEMAETADRVFTMGCSIEDVCAAVSISAEDWALDDPAGKGIEEVRRIRDEIEWRVRSLLSDHADKPRGWEPVDKR